MAARRREVETRIAYSRKRFERVVHISDCYDCLISLLDKFPALENVYTLLDEWSSEPKSKVAEASSVHRFKGREGQRVFLIFDDFFRTPKGLEHIYAPGELNQVPWRQEMNLLYVGLTRSKQDLYLIGELNAELTRNTAFSEHLLSIK